MSRQIMALMAAVVFPVMATYAGVVHARGAPASQSDSSPGRWGERVRRVGRVLCSYALATGWALFGAALIVVLLDDVRFIAGLDSFRGVKFAHVVPLLLGAWVFWPRENESVSGENRHRGIGNRTVRFWIRLGGAVLLGGGLFVYVLRTGNQGLPVWHVEESVRLFLEETLGARPRTKEFLIGHPALILALVGMVRRRANRYVVAGATVLGTIGPISIINTFAHVHSPLALSLARTGYGWVLGLLVGGLVALVAAVVVRLGQPSLPPPDRSVGGPQP